MAPKKTTTAWEQDNRDLLVELKTQMSGVVESLGGLRLEIKEIKDGMKSDIEFLKNDKISRAEAVRINTDQQVINAKTEEKLSFHDKVIYTGFGVIAAVEFAFKFLIK